MISLLIIHFYQYLQYICFVFWVIQYKLTTMLANRRTNDFDNFISQITPQSTTSPRNQPLAPVNPNYRTVSPRRDVSNQLAGDRSGAMKKGNNVRRPMISPTRSPRRQVQVPQQQISRVRMQMEQSQDYFCSNQNHPHKRAEFYIHVDNEDMYYCGKCATQAASQGFTVNKIGQKSVKSMPCYPQFQGHPRYNELMNLLKLINDLSGQFQRIDPRKMSEEYEQQAMNLNNFYEELIGTVQRMRDDHLADFEEEYRANLQHSDARRGILKVHADELGEAWQDVSQNIESIMRDVDQESFEKCMDDYTNKCKVFHHKLEEYAEEVTGTTYQKQELDKKVMIFEEKLKELWAEPEVKPVVMERERSVSRNNRANQMVDRNKGIKNVHEVLPQATRTNNEGKGAFRALFPEEQSEQRLPEASPQFKAF